MARWPHLSMFVGIAVMAPTALWREIVENPLALLPDDEYDDGEPPDYIEPFTGDAGAAGDE